MVRKWKWYMLTLFRVSIRGPYFRKLGVPKLFVPTTELPGVRSHLNLCACLSDPRTGERALNFNVLKYCAVKTYISP